MSDRARLHTLIDQLSEDNLVSAHAYLESLVAAQATVTPEVGVYHLLELPDPLGTAVVATVRLGPFPNLEAAQQVADAISADVASLYLSTGAPWETCVEQVLAGTYARLIAPVDEPPAAPTDLATAEADAVERGQQAL